MRRFHPVALVGALVFGLLFLYAVVFYRERIGNIDMAFQTFLMLLSGTPEVQVGRFGAVVTQVWPWAAQVLGLPLRGVMLAYSIGHVAWPALVFLWCRYLGQWQWAAVLLLLLTGMSTHTFYWLSEMPQGLVFLTGVLAWMSARGSLSALRLWEWPLWAGAVVTAFYFHPMVMYAGVFASLFFVVKNWFSEDYTEKLKHFFRQPASIFAGMILLFGAATFVKFKVLKLNWYDAAAMERTEAFGRLWPHWFDLQSNRDLLRYTLSDYWFLPPAIGAALVFYIWKKRWIQAALCLFYPLAYTLLVNIPYNESANQFYMENLWLPLGFFAAIPLVFDVLPAFFTEKTAAAIVGGIALAGLVRIGAAHEIWTARINWERNLLDRTAQLPNKKGILTEAQVPMDTFQLSWGMPYEFLLLSALESPDSARCILVTSQPQLYDSIEMREPRLFLGSFVNYPFDTFPKRYFNLRDTTAYVRW